MQRSPKSIRRVGVLGDVHAHDRLLERALEFFASRSLSAILSVGDIVDGEGDLERTIELLREAQVEAVAGNHERWLLHGEERHRAHATQSISAAVRSYLESLPTLRRYETPRGGLLLGHGVFDDDMAFLRPSTQGFKLQEIPALFRLMREPGIDYFIGGHTHERMVRTFTGITCINAGTLSSYGEPTVLIVDFEKERADFYRAYEDKAPVFIEALPIPRPIPLKGAV